MPNHNKRHPGFIEEISLSPERIAATQKAIHDAAEFVSNHALSTARIIIGAEELLRQRVRSVLRVAVATMFFAISGLISLGANVTTAFAKKISSERGSHGQTARAKRMVKYHPTSLHTRRHGKLKRSHALSHSSGARSSMRGVASWYGNQFHNRQTASGVRFDTHAMMAAHRTLPFGTKVRVTNLKNDKSCIVEITDRGPFSKGRIIDLSYAAAEEIGMTETGVANVEIEVMGSRLDQQSNFDDLALQKKGPVPDRIQKASSRPLASLLNVSVLDDQSR
jgi:rare lipoprotein A (peptidoglycan hydrolase)